MSASHPLHGPELISCARASLSLGVEAAARNCGYGQDVPQFQSSLQQACQEIGITLTDMEQVLAQPDRPEEEGVEISPDSPSSL